MQFWEKYKKVLTPVAAIFFSFNLAFSLFFIPKQAQASWGSEFIRGIQNGVVSCGLGAGGGAIAGTIIPVVGTAAGAIAGCLGGAVLNVGGEVAKQSIQDAVVDKIKKTTGVNVEAQPGEEGTSIFDGFILGLGTLALSLSQAILEVFSFIFTNVVIYNLNTALIPLGTIQLGWSTILSVANIFFIFAIVYISINTVLGLNGSNTYRLMGKVILVGLLINFSLIFTSIFIDASNIIAREFWFKITYNITQDGYPDIATAIGETYNLDHLITTAVEFKKQESGTGTSISAPSISAKNIGFMKMGVAIFVLISCFVLAAGAGIFTVRILKLIMIMISSPLAFISYIVPPADGVAKKWWGMLTSEALVAPVYMFFIYISFSMINNLPKATLQYDRVVNYLFFGSGGATPEDVFRFILNFFITSALLLGATVAAKMIAGETTKTGSSWASYALGTTAGGVAAVGRRFGGQIGERLYQGYANDTSGFGNVMRSTGDVMRKGSWDVRTAPVVGTAIGAAAGQAGLETNKQIVFKGPSESAGGLQKELKEAKTIQDAAEKERKETVRKQQVAKIKENLKDESAIQNSIPGYLVLSPDEQRKSMDEKVKENLKQLNSEEIKDIVGTNMSDPSKKHLLENLSYSNLKLINESAGLDDANKDKLKELIVANKDINKDGYGYYKKDIDEKEFREKVSTFKSRVGEIRNNITNGVAGADQEMADLIKNGEDNVIAGLDEATQQYSEVAKHYDASQLSAMLKEGKLKTRAARENIGNAVLSNPSNTSGNSFLETPAGRILVSTPKRTVDIYDTSDAD